MESEFERAEKALARLRRERDAAATMAMAAPDLLEALEIAVDAMNNTHLFETEIKIARAAIAKAKGE